MLLNLATTQSRANNVLCKVSLGTDKVVTTHRGKLKPKYPGDSHRYSLSTLINKTLYHVHILIREHGPTVLFDSHTFFTALHLAHLFCIIVGENFLYFL